MNEPTLVTYADAALEAIRSFGSNLLPLQDLYSDITDAPITGPFSPPLGCAGCAFLRIHTRPSRDTLGECLAPAYRTQARRTDTGEWITMTAMACRVNAQGDCREYQH